jgi:hypothetical protein
VLSCLAYLGFPYSFSATFLRSLIRYLQVYISTFLRGNHWWSYYTAWNHKSYYYQKKSLAELLLILRGVANYYSFSRDSSVHTQTSYELDGQEIWVRFPLEARDFSLLSSVQTGSGVQPAFCSISAGRSVPWIKAAGAWSWPFICR